MGEFGGRGSVFSSLLRGPIIGVRAILRRPIMVPGTAIDNAKRRRVASQIGIGPIDARDRAHRHLAKERPLAAARSCGSTTLSQSLREPDVAKIYPIPA